MAGTQATFDVTTTQYVNYYGNRSDVNMTSSDNLDAIMVPVIWSILVLIGSIGNGLVVYVLLRFGERSTTNYYIINLAVTDLAFLLICVPFTMMHYAAPDWAFGQTMCKFVMYMIYVTLHATCLTLTAMTVDRYFAIVRALSSMINRTPMVAVGVNMGIWTASLLLCIPFALYHGLITRHYGRERTYCQEMWPHPWDIVIVLYVVIVTYVIPMATIIICYHQILRHIYVRPASHSNNALSNRRSFGAYAEAIQTKKRKRVIKMVAVVVALFATFWLPIHVFHLWFKFDPHFPKNQISYYYKFAAHTLSYANSVVNPFVYAILGDGFKKALKRAFPRICAGNRVLGGANKSRFESLNDNSSMRMSGLRSTVLRTSSGESRMSVHEGNGRKMSDGTVSVYRAKNRAINECRLDHNHKNLPSMKHRCCNDQHMTIPLRYEREDSAELL